MLLLDDFLWPMQLTDPLRLAEAVGAEDHEDAVAPAELGRLVEPELDAASGIVGLRTASGHGRAPEETLEELVLGRDHAAHLRPCQRAPPTRRLPQPPDGEDVVEEDA